MMKRIEGKKVKELYVDEIYGIIFVTDKTEYAFQYYYDISGAICDIKLERVKNEKKTKT